MPHFKVIDIASAFYESFCKYAKRGRKIRRKKNEETKPIFEVVYPGTPEAISLKFGMWGTDVGGCIHSKSHLVLSRQHRTTEVRKLHFCSSCQYTHGCCALASWAARHTTMCLDFMAIVQYVMW